MNKTKEECTHHEFYEMSKEMALQLSQIKVVNELQLGDTSEDDHEVCYELMFRDQNDVQYSTTFNHICIEFVADLVYYEKGKLNAEDHLQTQKDIVDFIQYQAKERLEEIESFGEEK